ncbi:hypothetical protein P3S68_019665 [Capsicum galapagoense]
MAEEFSEVATNGLQYCFVSLSRAGKVTYYGNALIERYDPDVLEPYLLILPFSDENSYDALLEDLIDNDLAMNATIDNLELLIFSSRELPQQHWRLHRKYYLWGVFRHKSPSCSNIPTANVFAQTSSIQNAAISYLLNEVEGANTGCSQGQSFPSPLSILKGVNSGSPRGLFPRPLSSCYISTSTKDSPCHPGVRLVNMEHECSRNLDTRNQDVGQHDTCRMLTSDICVSTQLNGVVVNLVPAWSLSDRKGVFHFQLRGRLLTLFITVQPSIGDDQTKLFPAVTISIFQL